MTETTEETVLMKCSRCIQEEEVPTWILGELNEYNRKDEKDTIDCLKYNTPCIKK